ncbi:alpha/beta fold hydrolase [Ornithobacterium rhinotracheale]|uniref:alpha/beta fold hydrolase n=1 Tax=Ornithobacterium rhinotracheale TaxID=28251 RepID=UPI00129C2BFF|nr:alpha/beta fold hydrolase [Ornithobacterium rhinotracheale]MRI64044.1 alpha/beta fold hydrolase [Ornithobacterium rhinotracheale]
MEPQILFGKIIGHQPHKHLIILHGLFGMLDNWATLGRKFGEYFTTHLVDARNHGRSFHSSEISHKTMAEDLYHYMQAHKIKKASLIGHSLGGKVMMEFALKYPEMVEKLIVADMAPKDYTPHHQAILKALNYVDFNKVKSRGDVENFLKEYIKDPSIRMFLMKSIQRYDNGTYAFKFNLKSLTENYNDLITNHLPDKTFNGDVLFLGGGNSSYITEQDTMQIKKYFPHAEITHISGAGHWLHAEKPDEFLEICLNFLLK